MRHPLESGDDVIAMASGLEEMAHAAMIDVGGFDLDKTRASSGSLDEVVDVAGGEAAVGIGQPPLHGAGEDAVREAHVFDAPLRE
jgi:hypothetical protein